VGSWEVGGSSSAGGRRSVGVGGEAGGRGISIERSGGVSCAAGGGGDPGSIRHGADGAERLIGLSVGGDDTVGTGVGTREVLVVTEAAQEDIVNVGSGGVVSSRYDRRRAGSSWQRWDQRDRKP